MDATVQPKPNVELLQRTLARIEANPKEWYQGDWRRRTLCGTAMCFAGWAAQLDGGTWLYSASHGWSDLLAAAPGDADEDLFRVPDSEAVGVAVEHRAARILGLSKEQADRLFCDTNNLTDLRRIVAELCESAS